MKTRCPKCGKQIDGAFCKWCGSPAPTMPAPDDATFDGSNTRKSNGAINKFWSKMRAPFPWFLNLIILIFLWHVFVCLPSPDYPDISINPLTDVAVLKMPGPSALGITDPVEADAFRKGRDLTGISAGELSLNRAARKWFDIYAMVFPYQVEIVDK